MKYYTYVSNLVLHLDTFYNFIMACLLIITCSVGKNTTYVRFYIYNNIYVLFCFYLKWLKLGFHKYDQNRNKYFISLSHVHTMIVEHDSCSHGRCYRGTIIV